MDVKRKIWMRALSVFLATLMVIQILPLNAFAKDVVQKQAIEDTQPKVSDNDEITVKTEIESMRTENSKTFLTDDNGNNYMDTVINKQSGAATMYDIKPSSSPYKIGE